jgi:hypothetical protein
MRETLASVVALALVFSPQAHAEPASKLEVVAAGQSLSFEDSKQLSIRFWLQQLVLSALYRNVLQDSSPKEWQQALDSRSRIHCIYAETATLAIPERRTLIFDEALLPVTGGYPMFVFIKRGSVVLRLAKYDPWVYNKLVSEAGIAPASETPSVPRGLF